MKTFVLIPVAVGLCLLCATSYSEYEYVIFDNLCEAVKLELKHRVGTPPENTRDQVKKIFYMYSNVTQCKTSLTDQAHDNDANASLAARYYCCDTHLRDDLYVFIMGGITIVKFNIAYYIPNKICRKKEKVPFGGCIDNDGTRFETGPVVHL